MQKNNILGKLLFNKIVKNNDVYNIIETHLLMNNMSIITSEDNVYNIRFSKTKVKAISKNKELTDLLIVYMEPIMYNVITEIVNLMDDGQLNDINSKMSTLITREYIINQAIQYYSIVHCNKNSNNFILNLITQ